MEASSTSAIPLCGSIRTLCVRECLPSSRRLSIASEQPVAGSQVATVRSSTRKNQETSPSLRASATNSRVGRPSRSLEATLTTARPARMWAYVMRIAMRSPAPKGSVADWAPARGRALSGEAAPTRIAARGTFDAGRPGPPQAGSTPARSSAGPARILGFYPTPADHHRDAAVQGAPSGADPARIGQDADAGACGLGQGPLELRVVPGMGREPASVRALHDED